MQSRAVPLFGDGSRVMVTPQKKRTKEEMDLLKHGCTSYFTIILSISFVLSPIYLYYSLILKLFHIPHVHRFPRFSSRVFFFFNQAVLKHKSKTCINRAQWKPS